MSSFLLAEDVYVPDQKFSCSLMQYLVRVQAVFSLLLLFCYFVLYFPCHVSSFDVMLCLQALTICSTFKATLQAVN